MHGPDCLELVENELLFIREIDFVSWVKAIDRRTGMNDDDYIAIPFNGELVDQADRSMIEVTFMLLIKPADALAIVNGIAELLEGPRPPTIPFPGAN